MFQHKFRSKKHDFIFSLVRQQKKKFSLLFRFSSNSLGQLSLQQLTSLSRQKIDALQCHLLLESSLKQKHQDLQKKLAQLNQLHAVNDELTHLHALIKHDMSHGHSMIDYLRRLKEENVQLICDWKSMMNLQTTNNPSINKSVCQRETYSKMIRQFRTCSMDVIEHFPKRQDRKSVV